ncbi:MAG: GNAT family N-acetyltransferase [Casimicrobiaceae bacterium]|nr:GNAT family N-acetyltransferase [Casimicrobiaceae bacterium]MCX8097760.1 GNAT family N-acetyltransferase [Casimicrobiaceae bacterium]MDW8312728.1 GNAT family N-acetyltransferase [Burkholderiales bacterium]
MGIADAVRSRPHIRLRVAREDDLEAMNRLALRAKAHWGYDEDELARWRDAIEVRANTVREWPTFVAEAEGGLVGFVQMNPAQTRWALDALWVEPDRMGQGIGRRLLSHACRMAAAAGQRVLSIDADPNAVAFYVRMGARAVGYVPAPLTNDPERVRPQFLIETVAS